MEVRWSENASAEIVEVVDYLSRYSEAGAWRAVRAILGRGLQLERFPNSGRRIFPDSGDDIREVFAGPYRIVYHNAGDGVWKYCLFGMVAVAWNCHLLTDLRPRLLGIL